MGGGYTEKEDLIDESPKTIQELGEEDNVPEDLADYLNRLQKDDQGGIKKIPVLNWERNSCFLYNILPIVAVLIAECIQGGSKTVFQWGERFKDSENEEEKITKAFSDYVKSLYDYQSEKTNQKDVQSKAQALRASMPEFNTGSFGDCKDVLSQILRALKEATSSKENNRLEPVKKSKEEGLFLLNDIEKYLGDFFEKEKKSPVQDLFPLFLRIRHCLKCRYSKIEPSDALDSFFYEVISSQKNVRNAIDEDKKREKVNSYITCLINDSCKVGKSDFAYSTYQLIPINAPKLLFFSLNMIVGGKPSAVGFGYPLSDFVFAGAIYDLYGLVVTYSNFEHFVGYVKLPATGQWWRVNDYEKEAAVVSEDTVKNLPKIPSSYGFALPTLFFYKRREGCKEIINPDFFYANFQRLSYDPSGKEWVKNSKKFEKIETQILTKHCKELQSDLYNLFLSQLQKMIALEAHKRQENEKYQVSKNNMRLENPRKEEKGQEGIEKDKTELEKAKEKFISKKNKCSSNVLRKKEILQDVYELYRKVDDILLNKSSFPYEKIKKNWIDPTIKKLKEIRKTMNEISKSKKKITISKKKITSFLFCKKLQALKNEMIEWHKIFKKNMDAFDKKSEKKDRIAWQEEQELRLKKLLKKQPILFNIYTTMEALILKTYPNKKSEKYVAYFDFLDASILNQQQKYPEIFI